MRTATANYVAVDLGASSGRLVVGRWNGQRFALEELHRFANGYVSANGHLHWDVSRLWSEIKCGLSKYSSLYEDAPAGISVDAWGVDFALLDANGELLGDPFHYRDPRTDGAPERVFARAPERELFAQTGIQTMQINTLFQLFSMAESGDRHLKSAEHLLMIPDLFHYWLCGEKLIEYTEASTTQMLLCRERQWARDLLCKLQIPDRILGRIVFPGTVFGDLRSEVVRECGLNGRVPVIAVGSHDTASAVAAVPRMDANSAFISSGTWSLMGVESEKPITSEQALSLRFTNEGGVTSGTLLLRNISGLWLLQECVRLWRNEGHPYTWDDVTRMASEAAPFQSIVDVDASDFLAPENMPVAISRYCKRTGQAEPGSHGAMARCCLESLSLKYHSVLQALESLTGRELKTIRVVGGGSQSRLLCQLTADVCQRVVVAGPVEASALGNVMMQAVATGHLRSIEEGRQSIAASAELATYEPHTFAGLETAYERFRKLDTSGAKP